MTQDDDVLRGDGTSRRSALATGIGGMAALAAAAKARPAHAAMPDFDNPADLLTAFVKTRGAIDGSVSMGWIIGTRYAVVDSRITPLFSLIANTFHKYTRVDDNTFDMRTFEVAFYTDLATGKRLDTWENPLTGKVVEVEHVRTGPRVVPLRAEGFDYNAVPRTRTMDAINRNLPPVVMGDDVWMTDESRIAGPPTPSGETGFRYNGITTYHAKMSDVAKPDEVTVPATIQYESLVGFSPWMGMDGIDGTTMGRSAGRRAMSIEDLPPYYLELIETHHPDVLNDPLAALMGPRGYE